MEKTSGKKVNLNTLSTGCDPCLKSAKTAKRMIGNRKISELRLDEIKKIVSSFFNDKDSKI